MNRVRTLSAAAICIILIACFFLVRASAFNHDLAFILVGTQRLLDGGTFGIDVIDPNPPLAWWLSTIPLALGRLAGVAPTDSASAFTLILIPFSCGFLWRLSGPVHALIAAAVLCFLPGYDFGQREHWMAILALPWLTTASLHFAGKDASPAARATAGISGALAFCLKPHFVLVPLFVELAFAISRRSVRHVFRMENLLMAGLGVVYVAATALFSPQYLTDVLPYVLDAYWAFNQPVAEIALAYSFEILLVAAGWLLLARASTGPATSTRVFALAALGALGAVMLQQKGWPYHFLPAKTFALLGAAFLLIERPAREGRALIRAAAMIPILFACVQQTVQRTGEQTFTAARVAQVSDAIKANSSASDRVFAFITSPRVILPAVLQTGRTWASAACCVQWIPADMRAPERAPTDEAKVRRIARARFALLLDELEAKPPAIVFIDASNEKLALPGRDFDYLSYLNRSPRFRAFFAPYEERAKVAGYRIFVRPGVAGAAVSEP